MLFVSFSWMDSVLCVYHLFVLSNFNVLHNSLWITFPTQSYTLFALIFLLIITGSRPPAEIRGFV